MQMISAWRYSTGHLGPITSPNIPDLPTIFRNCSQITYGLNWKSCALNALCENENSRSRHWNKIQIANVVYDKVPENKSISIRQQGQLRCCFITSIYEGLIHNTHISCLPRSLAYKYLGVIWIVASQDIQIYRQDHCISDIGWIL